MEIPGLKVAKEDFERISSPLELDLIAYFQVASDAVMDMIDTAKDEGWTPEQLITEIDMLFDGTQDRIEYQNELAVSNAVARDFAEYERQVRKGKQQAKKGDIGKFGPNLYVKIADTPGAGQANWKYIGKAPEGWKNGDPHPHGEKAKAILAKYGEQPPKEPEGEPKAPEPTAEPPKEPAEPPEEGPQAPPAPEPEPVPEPPAPEPPKGPDEPKQGEPEGEKEPKEGREFVAANGTTITMYRNAEGTWTVRVKPKRGPAKVSKHTSMKKALEKFEKMKDMHNQPGAGPNGQVVIKVPGGQWSIPEAQPHLQREHERITKLKNDEVWDYAHKEHQINIMQNVDDKSRPLVNNVLYQMAVLKRFGLSNPAPLRLNWEALAPGRYLLNGNAKAYYQPHLKSITLGDRYVNSFFHEYFHHLDYTLRDPDAKAARAELRAEMHKTRTYKNAKDYDKKKGKSYWAQSDEMIARFGAEYMYYEMPERNIEPPHRVVERTSPNHFDFSESEYRKLKPLFEKVFFAEKRAQGGSAVNKSYRDDPLEYAAALARQVSKNLFRAEMWVEKKQKAGKGDIGKFGNNLYVKIADVPGAGQKNWKYIGPAPNGWQPGDNNPHDAKAKKIISDLDHGRIAAPVAGPKKAPGAPRQPKAPPAPKENTAQRKDRELNEWIDNNPDEFHSKLAGAIHQANPHPLFGKEDIKEKLKQKDKNDKNFLARQFNVRPKVPRPANWDQLGYTDRMKLNRDAFVSDIIAKRGGGDAKKKQYYALDDKALKQRAEMHLGQDPVKAAKEKAAQLKKQQAQAAKFKAVLTSPSKMNKPHIEKALVEGVENKNVPRVMLGDKNGNNLNSTYKVTLKDANGNDFPAVWKSLANECNRDFAGIPGGEQWIRERAAWDMNHAVGLDNHPAVVLRDMPGEGVGALMEFVPGKTWAKSGADYSDFPVSEWQKIALHGYLANACDMHGNNFMVDKASKRIYAIDNGLTFGDKYHQYRNEPHGQLNSHRNLTLEPDVMKLITPDSKKAALDALKNTGMTDAILERVGRRFDYVLAHKALPPFGQEVR